MATYVVAATFYPPFRKAPGPFAPGRLPAGGARPTTSLHGVHALEDAVALRQRLTMEGRDVKIYRVDPTGRMVVIEPNFGECP